MFKLNIPESDPLHEDILNWCSQIPQEYIDGLEEIRCEDLDVHTGYYILEIKTIVLDPSGSQLQNTLYHEVGHHHFFEHLLKSPGRLQQILKEADNLWNMRIVREYTDGKITEVFAWIFAEWMMEEPYKSWEEFYSKKHTRKEVINMSCKPKCKSWGYSMPKDPEIQKALEEQGWVCPAGSGGKKVMEAVEGNQKFQKGVVHPQCTGCEIAEKEAEKFIEQTLRETDNRIKKERDKAFDAQMKKSHEEEEEIFRRHPGWRHGDFSD